MAPTSLLQDISKLKHPNSRKTKALAKKAKRFNNRGKLKLGHAIKSNLLGDKFAWFTERIEDDKERLRLTPTEFLKLFNEYLHRFDEELDQIKLKQSICKNRSNQHASRVDAIRMTLERENGEFNGAGIELMNLCDADQFKIFINWDGNTINLQHIKLSRISKTFLDKLIADEGANKME